MTNEGERLINEINRYLITKKAIWLNGCENDNIKAFQKKEILFLFFQRKENASFYLSQLKERNLNKNVILVSVSKRIPQDVHEFLLRGVRGIIALSDLRNYPLYIASLINAEAYVFSKEVIQTMATFVVGKQNDDPNLFRLELNKKVGYQIFTIKEFESVQALLDGKSVQSACERLKISRHTYKNHIMSAMTKMNVNTRTKLINKLLKEKLAETKTS